MSRATVWITGIGGLLGNSLARTARQFAGDWTVVGPTRAQLDLADFPAVRRVFRELNPSLLIHCAAISRSTFCQENPGPAHQMNVEVTRNLCELAANIPLIFFSSDLVFDGRKARYVETDLTNPLSVYAETKLEAEQIVLANPRHSVLRLSLIGGTSPTGDRGFNEEMRRAWQAGRTLRLFTDEFRCPLPAVVAARAVWEFVARANPGLYHLAGAERLSRWQIGELIAARWPGLQPRIEPASIADYRGAPRPADCSLDSTKIQRLLGFTLPGLGEWLRARPEEEF